MLGSSLLTPARSPSPPTSSGAVLSVSDGTVRIALTGSIPRSLARAWIRMFQEVVLDLCVIRSARRYPLPLSSSAGFADKYSSTREPCSANAAAITFRGFWLLSRTSSATRRTDNAPFFLSAYDGEQRAPVVGTILL